MGFQKSAKDPSPPPDVTLRVVGRKDFQIMQGFAYKPADGPVLEVPAHDPGNRKDTTDLASVPPLLWGLLASYGRQLRAALLHDRLCNEANALPKEQRKAAAQLRRRADDLFQSSMRDVGDGSEHARRNRVSWLRSWIFWAGVSFGRYWKFDKLRAFPLTIHVLLGIAALYTGNFVALAILLGLSIVWWRDARLVIIGILVGAVVLPVLLVNFVAQAILAAPDGVLKALRPNTEPPATVTPTINFR